MTENGPIKFKCVTCGACCQRRFVPLTLEESRAWIERGHQVCILLEAIAPIDPQDEPVRFQYNAKRGVAVRSGQLEIHVIAIFAGEAWTRCPNLDEDDLCRIYEQRPLICRVYPLEISPFIPFRTEAKDCPLEAWKETNGDVVVDENRQVSAPLRHLIEASRAADRADARAKIAICERLGYSVTAWHGDGYAIYTPRISDLQSALTETISTPDIVGNDWRIEVSNQELGQKLQDAGAMLSSNEDNYYVFYPLNHQSQ